LHHDKLELDSDWKNCPDIAWSLGGDYYCEKYARDYTSRYQAQEVVMAVTIRLDKTKAGDTVYRPFKPNNPGIITESNKLEITVMWWDGSTNTYRDLYPCLNSFDELIMEHKRKAKNFEAMRNRLINML